MAFHLSKRKKVAIALLFSLIMIGSAFVVSTDLIKGHSGAQPGIPMSNITLNMSVSPSTVAYPFAAGSSAYSFLGALVEIWPVYHPFSSTPSYLTITNVSPMVAFWTCSSYSWHSSFKLPAYFITVENNWREYFGSIHDGSTSLIAMISYFASGGSTYDLVYTYTYAIPYNPFSVTNGSVIQSDIHPDLVNTPYFTVPSNETPVLSAPVYGNASPASSGVPSTVKSTGDVYTPDSLPYPNGTKYYWTWRLINVTYFINAEIPISYLNATMKGLNAQVADTVYMGSTEYSTQFSMAQSYDYSGTESYSMGTNAVYSSGLVSGANGAMTFPGSNLTRYDAVLTINGNATIWRYQWVEYGPFGHVVATADRYSTDIAITSLNESRGQFHISWYYAGYVNLKKYNDAAFSALPLQQRYQQAFGIYFNGTDSRELWGNPSEINNITNLGVDDQVAWQNIYASIKATTSNLEGEITSQIAMLGALAGVAMALSPSWFGDSADLASLIVALVGFSVSVASLFESGVFNVTANNYIYGGYIENFGTDNGGSPVTVSDWYTPADINVNGETYQFATNYAIIT